ncbi:MAG: hypothetical protein KF760_00220 [Candidatus Eremiobacteraeota bacterium]|nr:hypothetical protein [Candidatus Eremiobacteraeota bacterium]MCW5870376.1 hypothetical protein [Candidatus Eremiobacteraeota bacterium]
MKIQRPQIEARNSLNFSQIKQAPGLQAERFKSFVDGYEEKPVKTALENATKLQKNALYESADSRVLRNGWGAAALVGTGAGAWAAGSGSLVLGGAIGAAVTGAVGVAVYFHVQSKKQDAEAALAGEALQAMTRAADELAAGLVCDGPGPDQFTDKRYFTGGVINQIATVHSRESGAVLRTQVDLGGAVPRRLEANIAKNTVSVRSPKGDQTFAGELKLNDQGFALIAHGQPTDTDGPLTQTIHPDGSSRINAKVNNWSGLSFSSSEASGKDKGFQASTYVWENGQLASLSSDTLYVANPIVPFQDLSKVRVLPDGVVGGYSDSAGTHQADEAVLPPSHGIGTWSSVSNPQLTPRLIETHFPGGFTALSDQKTGIVRITAGDGATLDTNSTLVETNQAYRLHTQHTLGALEQSLLPNEVLLHLQDGARTVSVQHKSGSQPTASEHKDEEFLSSGHNLEVSLDEKGIYRVGEGAAKIDIKPLMPLEFLEKRA